MDDLVQVARSFDGEPYSQANPGRYQINSGFKDCSGLWVAAHTLLHLDAPGYVSSTQAAYCYDAGLEQSVDWVMEHGGVLFMGADRGLAGYGPDGHVAVKFPASPNGYETPAWGIGRHGVGEDSFENRNWSGGASAFPGLVAFGQIEPAPLPTPAPKPSPKKVDYLTGEDMLLAIDTANHCTLFQGDRLTQVTPTQAFGLRAQNVPTVIGIAPLSLLQLAKDLAPAQYSELVK